MNRICPTILAAVALSGCGGPNYTLSGRAGLAPGDTLRLCSPYENDSVLATTVIRRDSSFRIRGHVSEPTIANLMHNDRRIGAPIQLEAADIRLEPTGDVRGFQFTGTPLNDAFNAMNAAQVSLGNVLQALENEPDTPERRRKLDSLGRIYRQIPGDALEANRDNLLDGSYIPGDLVKVTAKHVSGTFQLRKTVNDALLTMFAAANEDGCTLYVKSAYRSYQTQRTMYYNRLEKNGGKDDGWVSYPGASDHQTGLGVDILNYAWTQKDGMNEKFAQTAEAQWMAAHCHEYGFVIRYMDGKQEITGISFEPWHLRYVGPECAEYMMTNNLSLEEFTAEWQAYAARFEQQSGMTLDAYCKLLSAPKPAVETGETGEDGDTEISMFYDTDH